MLTAFQTKKWTHLFHIYDTDNSGVVTEEDFELKAKAVAKLYNIKPESTAYHDLFSKVMADWEHLQKDVDKNNDNQISLEEWLDHGYTRITDDEMYKTVYKEADAVFDQFDSNGDGVLSEEEYINVITAWGGDTAGIKSVFSKLDLNGDGTISKDEFKQLLEQFHKSDNPNDPGNYFFGPF